ncbi:MAG: MFS transporter [Pseudomonadota bacterium]
MNPAKLSSAPADSVVPAKPAYPPVRLAFMMWGMAVGFYLFGFFHRVTPAVLTSELMRDFKLSAAMLGNLSAFYFYFYAAMQIPTGILVDRFGPRTLLWIGALIGGIGALMFAFADDFTSAAIGRGLIGGTVAVAWVSMLKLSSHWFDSRRLGTVTGIALAIGTMGAVLAGLPLRALSDAFGWQTVIAASGFVALCLALAIFFLMRDDPCELGFESHAFAGGERKPASMSSILRGLGEIWRYPNVALLFWVPSGIVGAFLTFTGLWGVPFLVQLHGMTPKSASLITSGMLIAFSAGAILFGHLGDRWRRRKSPYVLGGVCVVLGFGGLWAMPGAPLPVLVPLLMLAGLGSGSMALGFLYVKESLPLRLSGTAVGAVNMGVMVGPLTQQPVIGWILDRYWDGALQNGVRLYGTEAYRMAFAFLVIWVLTAFVALLLTRDTFGKQYRE